MRMRTYIRLGLRVMLCWAVKAWGVNVSEGQKAARVRPCPYGTDGANLLTGAGYERGVRPSLLGAPVVNPASMTPRERQVGASLFQPAVQRGVQPDFATLAMRWQALAWSLHTDPRMSPDETIRNTTAQGLRALYNETEARSRYNRTVLDMPSVQEAAMARLSRDLANPGDTAPRGY